MSDIERLVLNQLRSDGATTRRGSVRFPDLVTEQPTNYADGITAARHLMYQARGVMRDYATKARGHGVAWADLAGPLEVVPDTENYEGPGEAAFKWVAGKPSQRFDPITVSWRCETCGEYVIDSGPYDHPSDNEKGHAGDCARHQAEIAAYQARWDD